MASNYIMSLLMVSASHILEKFNLRKCTVTVAVVCKTLKTSVMLLYRFYFSYSYSDS